MASRFTIWQRAPDFSSDMEIYHLRTFAAVAKIGHVTNAAKVLHLTQPAVTGHLKALEQELGITLFDRGNSRVTLTRAGEMLLPDAEKTLALFNATLAKAKKIRNQITGKVRIGTLSDPDFLRLGSFLNGLISALPLLEIKTSSMLAESIHDGVSKGDIAGGFYIGSAHSPNVAGVPLRCLRYRVVAPVPMASELAASGMGEIAAMRWIGAPDKSHIHQLMRAMFDGHGLTPNIVMETDEFTMPHNLVRAGLGLSLMREDLALIAAERGEIALCRSAFVDTRLSFLYSASAEFEPTMVGMLSVLRETWDVAV